MVTSIQAGCDLLLLVLPHNPRLIPTLSPESPHNTHYGQEQRARVE